jgi:photoactive yellow protein
MSAKFDQSDLLAVLESLDAEGLDALDFGVIAFGEDDLVLHYNSTESSYSGLLPAEVIGRSLFTQVAQCMNNFMVAQRFEDAAAQSQALDVTMDYVLTWRMRPMRVQLRLLSAPAAARRYVLLLKAAR